MKKEKITGNMTLKDTVDITDPCYTKDVWCRLNGIPVAPGNYECAVTQVRETDKNGRPYYVNGSIMIRKEGVIPDRKNMKPVGIIGVDSGLAGFFPDKPDYDDNAWQALIGMVDGDDSGAWITDDGFFAETGYGDGGYEVLTHCGSDGKADAIEIICI